MKNTYKVKLKNKDKKIKGFLTFNDGFIVFTEENGDFVKKIPAYRVVQTGYRKNFFNFEFKFYLKTNDGLPTVFYCCYPKKLMKILDDFLDKNKNKHKKYHYG